MVATEMVVRVYDGNADGVVGLPGDGVILPVGRNVEGGVASDAVIPSLADIESQGFGAELGLRQVSLPCAVEWGLSLGRCSAQRRAASNVQTRYCFILFI